VTRKGCLKVKNNKIVEAFDSIQPNSSSKSRVLEKAKLIAEEDSTVKHSKSGWFYKTTTRYVAAAAAVLLIFTTTVLLNQDGGYEMPVPIDGKTEVVPFDGSRGGTQWGSDGLIPPSSMQIGDLYFGWIPFGFEFTDTTLVGDTTSYRFEWDTLYFDIIVNADGEFSFAGNVYEGDVQMVIDNIQVNN